MTPFTESEIKNLMICIEIVLETHEPTSVAEHQELVELAEKLQFMRPKTADITPPWRTIDEATQDSLAILMMEEIRDSTKDYAFEALDTFSIDEVAEYGLSEEGADDDSTGNYTAEQIADWIKRHVVVSE